MAEDEVVLRKVEQVVTEGLREPKSTVTDIARGVVAALSDAFDPRALGGDIAGPGGPFDAGGVVIDGSKAILMSSLDVAKIDPKAGARGHDDRFAVMVKGRINQTQDQGTAVVFCDLDGLAAFITEAHGVAERASKPHAEKLRRLCGERWARMPHPLYMRVQDAD